MWRKQTWNFWRGHPSAPFGALAQLRMLLYLAVSNFKGIVLSELPLKAGDSFRDIVHEVLDSGSLPTEDTLVSYTAGE
jgi:hypothetical protein